MSVRPDSASSASSGAGLVVVLSTERSGSTLLSQMLGAHSRALAPPELHLFSYSSFDGWRKDYPPAMRSLVGAYEMLGDALDEDVLCRRFGGRPVGAIYDDLLSLTPSDHLLIDKTPAYARNEGALKRAELFRPFFVWLVRHPLGVASSRIERVREKRGRERGLGARLKYPLFALRQWIRRETGNELRHELNRWCNAHERIERFLAQVPSDRWHRIHFEDLVRNPEVELEHLCCLLSLELEPAMLDPRANLPSKLGWGIGDQKIREHSTIDPAIADRWREAYAETAIDARTLEIMQRLEIRS